MAVAVDPKALAAEEIRWYRENPDPQSTPTLENLKEGDDILTLWNFPVAKADLGPAHRAVLEKFAAPGLIAETLEHPRMDFDVVGHASVTGTEQSNVDYAQQRADTVAEFLGALGIMKVHAESRGSSQPDDEGTSGQALARNRRVIIRRSLSTYRVVPPAPPPKQAPADIKATGPREVTVKIDLKLKTLQTLRVVITPSMRGDLKVLVSGGKTNPEDAGVTTTPEGQPVLTPEFAQFFADEVMGPRLGVDGGTAKEPVSINVAVATEEWFLTPKVVYQDGAQFISFNFKAVDAKFLPVVNYNGAQVSLVFSGSINFVIGPSEAAKGTYLHTTDPGPNVTGTAGQFIPVEPRALAIARTMADAGMQVPPLAQEDVKKIVLNLARRDGAACRVANIVIGRQSDPAFQQMRADWKTVTFPGEDPESEQKQALNAWKEGSNQVDSLLQPLDAGERDARKNKWKQDYGGQDFDFTRESVFQKLKGYDEDQGDLPQLIKGL